MQILAGKERHTTESAYPVTAKHMRLGAGRATRQTTGALAARRQVREFAQVREDTTGHACFWYLAVQESPSNSRNFDVNRFWGSYFRRNTAHIACKWPKPHVRCKSLFSKAS